MTAQKGPLRSKRFPVWVPNAARNYLAHTQKGLSIRAVARESACHPSTVLRQVRRFEGRRDDPLIDAALDALSDQVGPEETTNNWGSKEMILQRKQDRVDPSEELTQRRIDQEAKRILRRLCEPGAVLAVAREMETAVVVRAAGHDDQLRTAVVDREIAQAMALKDWITCPDPENRVARYFITNTGRAALRRLTAEDENRAHGLGHSRGDPESEAAWDLDAIDGGSRRTRRYHGTESPLVGLARRKDRDGSPFLDRALVVVGERLREDFELAQLSGEPITKWDDIMGDAEPVDEARKRVRAALGDLGPGLGDIVLQCCCLLEGLEHTEKSMGWSARSGKIVLRIALERLQRHYETTGGKFGPLIG
ncbi:helix-turn-helix domain containing protein [Loktanella sp. D2R18]|uniref:DUF6456 domain-containing protein n=1 Tax=Rhodobacterales TaxID=204455 RepID=UPI000DEB76D6|nr:MULTISPECIES: DUF6456 domain-containing protein [Rhodobacterales]MDO6589559.1 DUF6456 domain-containing protein [Yoonia sp. 1_MG-2023]RBW44200.1 helix-turn-helix domain containing protein [Loktanella sp. D2R18]